MALIADRIRVISPVDGEVFAEIDFSSGRDIRDALKNAARAQAALAQYGLERRQALCLELVYQLRKQGDALGEEITWQIGRPKRYANGELDGVQERIEYLVAVSDDAGEQSIQTRNGRQSAVFFEPIGVVLAIAPWNYPFLTSINAVVPALLAGSPVILKPSPRAPLSAERLAAAALAAGFPEGALQILHLDNADVAPLIAERGIGRVVFTGSVQVGRMIGSEAGRSLTPVTLELGGNDAAYVRRDANVAYAANEISSGAFFNSGQSCCGVERILVDSAIYDEFLDSFSNAMNEWQLGNPLGEECTLGPMVSAEAGELLRARVAQAVNRGARQLKPASEAGGFPNAAYHPATALLVSPDDEILCHELFGPVVSIIKVQGDAQAVARINNSDFGLTASIWTTDKQAVLRLSPQLDVGTVYANACDYLDPFLPWSGRKDSGVGFSLSRRAIIEMMRPKSIHMRDLPFA